MSCTVDLPPAGRARPRMGVEPASFRAPLSGGAFPAGRGLPNGTPGPAHLFCGLTDVGDPLVCVCVCV